ncbi:glycosyltransferase family 2 protein [Dethiobacter alkaliphilus]|uniref:Glucosyl-3-phosphoglycerate synthase n=1 Tax=Dethiobacter alkaliphilus AHT 1 TaxID=555088 RepID=C0GIV3_DETAL|nr:glycosyltransferase family 2 protein [Dethiobacter alkaliphilus]EEG76767.1 glycosyl transferase family 2 [Dethiobacter alkaliphilus AHT 1]MCW3490848.1 glycosyltransferase family 2 protein [Dethiobacter alkaliphilus]
MRIIAIIPAYNEEKTIGGVLEVLGQVPRIEEVIVVNDGSTDQTAQVVAQYSAVTLVNLDENRGKGGAIQAGLDRSRADVVLFLDADLIGLRTDHVEQLLDPVTNNDTVMSIGLFENGRVATDLAQKVAPYLSGQRAVRRDVLEAVDDLDISRFGVEVAITRLVEARNLPVREVFLDDLTHVTKEEKLGVFKGFAARMKMYWEIVRYYARIDSPK